MDILVSLLNGILIALEPINLGLAIVGVIVGLFVGAMLSLIHISEPTRPY